MLLLFLTPLAHAQTAQDMTSRSTVTDDKGQSANKATDRKPKTAQRESNSFCLVSLPPDCPIHHIYIELQGEPQPLAVQVKKGEVWVDVAWSRYAFAHQYFEVEGLSVFASSTWTAP